jgi:AMP-activated protein kinase-like protein
MSVLRMACLVSFPLVVAVAAVPVAAQQWRADAYVGRMQSTLNPAAAASNTVMAVLRYEDALSAFRVSAGLPTGSGEPLWGALSGTRRFAYRADKLIAGIDLSAHGFMLRDPAGRMRGLLGLPLFESEQGVSGYALAAQAMPMAGIETARWQAHARFGFSHYLNHFGEEDGERTVRLADVQLTMAPASSFALVPALRRYDAEETGYTYAGVTGLMSQGRASFWATIGSWLDQDTVSVPWSLGAALRLHERLTLSASASRESLDPLYRNPAQESWSASLSYALTHNRTPAPPVPAVYANGRATIRLPASPQQTRLSIAGDFNGWKPQPMQRAGNDWTFTAAIAPGVYNYAFVNERGEWFVPDQHPGRKDDGMGGHVAVLVVQ